MADTAANAAALSALGALLAIVTFLGGFASSRLHGAYRDALRDLRESEHRLDRRAPGHIDGRLDPELRWIAEVRDAARDSRWRESAALMGLLCVASVVLGIWALTEDIPTIDTLAVLALIIAAVLVTLLLVLDGSRIRGTLAATVRRSPLWKLLSLENLLADTHRATVRLRTAHCAWLRARAARHPLAGVLARWRERRFRRAERQRLRAVKRLERWDGADAMLDDLATAGVRPPEGYVDGLRGLLPLLTRGSRPTAGRPRPLDDDAAWNAALADLARAVDLDQPRRRRWLSALAACAELRDDPVARESAARWALELARLAPADPLGSTRRVPAGLAADRADPLPDVAVVEPRRPTTWEGAFRRARETGAHPWLVAPVLSHWAYALVLDQPEARDVDTMISPVVSAAVEVMGMLPDDEVDSYLRRVRPGLAELGPSGAQMGRLVPPRTPAAPPPTGAASRGPTRAGASGGPLVDPPGAGRPSASPGATGAAAAGGPAGVHSAGAGPVGAGPVGAGPVGAHLTGAPPAGAGPAGTSPVGAGPVGAGPADAAASGATRATAAVSPAPPTPDPDGGSTAATTPGGATATGGRHRGAAPPAEPAPPAPPE